MLMKRFFAFLAVAVAATTMALAVPAKRVVKTVTQPDGTTLDIVLSGDEFASFYTTTDGTPLRHDAVRGYVPMTTEEFGALRTRHDTKSTAANARRMAPKRVGSSTKPTGEASVLVILVEYTDCAFQPGSKAQLQRSLNEANYRSGRGYGSAADFFREQSDGKFLPTFDIYGPYKASHDMAYYGAHDGEDTNDIRPADLVKEACQLADADVDFKKYDADHDGEVDFCYVIYAGYAEAHGADDNTIWPHNWYISAGTGSALKLDNTRIDQYACSSELVGASGTDVDGIGTICHEFSHTLGLPDFYDVDYNGHYGMYSWSIMDNGCYNDGGYTPCSYTAYEKDFFGWKKLETISTEQALTLKPLDAGGVGYKIVSQENEKEYIVIENIQQTGWNRAAMGHGMLAVHVDYNATAWARNNVNTGDVQHMTVIAADNDYTTSYSSGRGDPYPGTSGNTELSDYSTPNTLTNKGFGMGQALTNISEKDGVITADFMSGSSIKVEAQAALNVNAYSFRAGWSTMNKGINSYSVDVYLITDAPEKEKKWTDALLNTNGVKVQEITTESDSYTITNLEAEQLYAYRVRGIGDGVVSSYSNTVFVKTTADDGKLSAPVLNEQPAITDTTITFSWSPVKNASYLVELTATPLEQTATEPDGTLMLAESFDAVTQSAGDITRVLDKYTVAPDWRGNNVFGGSGEVILGTEDEDGYLVTPFFESTFGPITIEFSIDMVDASDGKPIFYIYLASDANDTYYIDGIGAYAPDNGRKNYYVVLDSLDTGSYVALMSGVDTKDTTSKPRVKFDNLKFFWGDLSSEYGVRSDIQRMDLKPAATAQAPAKPRRITASNAVCYTVRDTVMEFRDLPSALYTARVRAIVKGSYSPYSNAVASIFGDDTYEVDGLAYQFYSKSENTVMVSSFRKGYYEGDVVIPETVEIAGRTCSVIAINDSAFAGSLHLRSVTVPASIRMVGERIFKGCHGLGYVMWNTSSELADESFVGTGNVLVYVHGDTSVEDERVTVIRDGEADEVHCYVNYPFLTPEPFTAKLISYTKNFDQKTVIGSAAGWETLSLPFDVTEIYRVEENKEAIELTPYGAEGTHHFWLARFNGSSFEYATEIKAGEPYIIAFPNSDEYNPAKRLAGDIIFGAENAQVIATTDAEPVRGKNMDFCPVFVKQYKQNGVFALNSYDEGTRNALPGSVFYPNSLGQRTFGAVLKTKAAASAPASFPIRFFGETRPVESLVEPSVTYQQGEPAIVAYGPTTVDVVAADGRCVRTLTVGEGITPVQGLEKGVYVILGHKVIVK